MSERVCAVKWQEDSAMNVRTRIVEVLRKYNVHLADAPLDALTMAMERMVDNRLLRPVNEPLAPGCYCKPGRCMAPRPEWCRDAEKRDTVADAG